MLVRLLFWPIFTVVTGTFVLCCLLYWLSGLFLRSARSEREIAQSLASISIEMARLEADLAREKEGKPGG